MKVLAFDPFVAAERYRELGVERAETPEALYARADIITIHLPEDPRDDQLRERRGLRADEGRRADHQLRARRADRPRRARRGADVRQGGGREPRRVPGRADDRAPDLRPRERDRDAAPRRLDRRGAGPRRRDHRRAGGRGAERRPGLERRQHPEGRQRGPRRARALPAARGAARAPRDVAREAALGRPDRGRLPRPPGRARHAPGDALGAERRVRGRVAENVNFVNAPAIAEERGIRVSELNESESRDYANLVSVAVVADGDRVEVAGTTFGPRHVPTSSRSTARASTSSWRRTWRSSATPTCRA